MTWALGDPVASDGWGSFADRNDLETAAPYPAIYPRPADAGPRRDAGHDRDRPARQPPDRRSPPGPAWQIIEVNDRARSILRHADGLSDRDGVLCAREAADRLRLERLVASALPASGAVAVSGSMLLGRSSASPPFRGARQTRRCSTTGLRSAAYRRLDTDYRAEEPASDRPRPGGRDPGADADGESSGGRVGGRQERPRHGRGHGAHPRLHLLAPEADLP